MDQDYKVGMRVELVNMFDEYTKLEAGAQGTISFIDSLGTLHVKWDDGHTIGLIPEIDYFNII